MRSGDGAARVALTVGSLPVLSVVGMEIVVGDRTWSTGADGDGAIRVGQAFQDGERWLIDATDANVETWSRNSASTAPAKAATWCWPAP
jgi:hypothetical protein